jgi:hypothetical protein
MMNRRIAAVKLQEQIRRDALRLVPGNPSNQDELCSYVTIALLECPKKYAKEGYYASMARSRALDWLRQEKKRTSTDLKHLAHQRSERLSLASRRRRSQSHVTSAPSFFVK